jgi:hypothetical protein
MPNSSTLSSIIVTTVINIQFAYPQSILKKLEEEAFHQDWQLQYLDSFWWQALMGLPMGLVALI